jgi:hypothetical protein
MLTPACRAAAWHHVARILSVAGSLACRSMRCSSGLHIQCVYRCLRAAPCQALHPAWNLYPQHSRHVGTTSAQPGWHLPACRPTQRHTVLPTCSNAYCPQEYLQWQYREPRIISELQHYSADLLCLQEVETSFYDKLLPQMQQQGYGGTYQSRVLPEVRARGSYGGTTAWPQQSAGSSRLQSWLLAAGCSGSARTLHMHGMRQHVHLAAALHASTCASRRQVPLAILR